MERYRIRKGVEQWKYKAYDYIRTDAFCVGQNIPVEMEFNRDEPQEELEAVLLVEDHKPVAGCRITYPAEHVGKIERVCVVREKQKSGYGRLLIEEAENWIRERGIQHIIISSQDRAADFYGRLGYHRSAEQLPEQESTPADGKPDLGFSCVLVEKYL